MDKLHGWYSRDSVKKTMLKHEEIFKEQVCELHRLYRVQKLLMAELRNKNCKIQSHIHSPILGKPNAQYEYINSEPKTEFWNSAVSSNTSNYQYNNRHPINETCTRDNGQWFQARDLNSQEASCCSRDTLGSQRSFDLERPAEEYAADDVNIAGEEHCAFQRPLIDKLCIGSPQNQFNCTEQETNIELTLGTGGSKDVQKKREWWECQNPEFGCSSSSSREIRLLIPSTSGWSESIKKQTTETQRFMITESPKEERSGTFDHENLQQPQWMFQALPLHRTS